MRYSVDPAAVAALGQAWDATGEVLRRAAARAEVVDPVPGETGRALAEFLDALRRSLVSAGATADATGEVLRAAAVAYAAVDAPARPALSPPGS